MNSSKQHKSFSLANGHSNRESGNLCVVLGNQTNLKNTMLDWKKGMGLSGIRNMAVDFGMKSRPVSTRRGTPTDWLNSNTEKGNQVKVFQNQIYLQAPDIQVGHNRGLSGSKIRKSSATSGTSGRSQASSFASVVDQEISVPPTPRPPSLKFKSRLSNTSTNALLVNAGSARLGSFTWNSSDQALRLQSELSKLSSSRALKRASVKRVIYFNVSQTFFGIGKDGPPTLEKAETCYSDISNTSSPLAGEFKCNTRTATHKLEIMQPRPGAEDVLPVTSCTDTHTETRSNGKHSMRKSRSLPPVTASNDFGQQTELGNNLPTQKSSDCPEVAESETVIDPDPGISKIVQETELDNTLVETNNMHHETELDDIQTGSNEIDPDTGSNDIDQETVVDNVHPQSTVLESNTGSSDLHP